MSEKAPIIYAEVRGAKLGGKSAILLYGDQVRGDPLMLLREPDNPADGNAVRVLERETESFIGYIAREKAAIMAPFMDAGWMYFAKVINPPQLKFVSGRRLVKKNSMVVKATPIEPPKATVEAKAWKSVGDARVRPKHETALSGLPGANDDDWGSY